MKDLKLGVLRRFLRVRWEVVGVRMRKRHREANLWGIGRVWSGADGWKMVKMWVFEGFYKWGWVRMGLEKWDLKIWKILRVPFQFSGAPSPLFFEKCASQYILLRFLAFSCFTFAISETFLFFRIFCSIFPLFSLSVLLVLFTIP